MSDQPPPLKDPFAIGDDERDQRARRTPVPTGPAELPDPFAKRVAPPEQTPAPQPATRALKRPALSDTPVARKPFTQVLPAPGAPEVPPSGSDQTGGSDQATVTMVLDGSDQPTVAMPGFAGLTGRELTMPRMQDWLVEALNRENVTVTTATKHPAFSLLDRQRLLTWQRRLYGELDSAAPLLLPAK